MYSSYSCWLPTLPVTARSPFLHYTPCTVTVCSALHHWHVTAWQMSTLLDGFVEAGKCLCELHHSDKVQWKIGTQRRVEGLGCSRLHAPHLQQKSACQIMKPANKGTNTHSKYTQTTSFTSVVYLNLSQLVAPSTLFICLLLIRTVEDKQDDLPVTQPCPSIPLKEHVQRQRQHSSVVLFLDWQRSHNLQSATTTLCQMCMTTTFAKRAFQCSALAVWNSLPKTVVNSDSVTAFKSRLKTFLFSRLSLFPLLINTLPGLSASAVTTLWHYTNLFIIIIDINIHMLTYMQSNAKTL